MLDSFLLTFFNADGLYFDAKIVLIPAFGEVIAAVDQAISTVDADMLSDLEILGSVVLLGDLAHSGVVGLDGLPGQFLFFSVKEGTGPCLSSGT